MYNLKGGTGGGLWGFGSTICGSSRVGSTGCDSYLCLRNRKRHIMMATRARSRLDMSTTIFIGWLSEGGMFSVSWEILTMSKISIPFQRDTLKTKARDQLRMSLPCLGYGFPPTPA